jgi:holin-like protein
MLLPLLAWGPVARRVEAIAAVLLQHLSLLFVPVGVGVIVHLGALAPLGWKLLVVIVASTWVGMVVTVLVLRALLDDTPAGAGPGPDGAASGTAGGGRRD